MGYGRLKGGKKPCPLLCFFDWYIAHIVFMYVKLKVGMSVCKSSKLRIEFMRESDQKNEPPYVHSAIPPMLYSHHRLVQMSFQISAVRKYYSFVRRTDNSDSCCAVFLATWPNRHSHRSPLSTTSPAVLSLLMSFVRVACSNSRVLAASRFSSSISSSPCLDLPFLSALLICCIRLFTLRL